MSITELAQAIDVPESVVAETVAELAAFYDETGRGFELRELGGGWRYYTREEHADLITRYVLEGQQAKLSQAALETLAVIAYSQPISRGRVAAVRGVNVDGVIRTCSTRLIEEAGHDHESGCGGLRHHQLLLRADGPAVAGRPAAARAPPAGGGGARGRAESTGRRTFGGGFDQLNRHGHRRESE
jgi:segregation and condensation protein B